MRKQVYIDAAQERVLKQRTVRARVSEAALIRQGLDLILRTGGAGLPDPRAWKEEMGFLRSRAGRSKAVRKRSWRREDLYEERLSRRH